MKKLARKGMALAALVCIAQIAVGNLTEERAFPKRDQIDEEISGGAELLVFGDSVMKYAYSTDRDTRKLREMLREGLSPRKVALVDGPAYGAEMFLDIMRYVLRRGVRPRAVLLPINLRSFSILWDRMPHFQYARERARLRWGDTLALGLNRPLMTYHVYSRLEGYPPSEKDHQLLPVYRGAELMGPLQEILAGTGRWGSVPWNARAFSVIYLYPLEPDHRKIRAIQQLGDLCRRENISIFAYVTPIDVDGGTQALGPGFREQVTANISIIRQGLKEHGIPLLDLSFAVQGTQFEWKPFPNEHLKDDGRIWLANQLITRIKGLGF